ncbi:glycosyltransferase [Bacillus tianshenii]|uniref:glycosyltransferase n=1 Tax=Sutcliffiella tianshenii TaxID=1463404 RepID=UPI00195A9606
MEKVLLITNTVAPYRISVLNKLSSYVDLDVWYLQEKEANRKWKVNLEEIKYKYVLLYGFHLFIQKLDMGIHINPGMFIKLIKESPDTIIIPGYDNIGYWVAMIYCKIFRKKCIVWWGSTLDSSRIQNKIVNRVRKTFFKKINHFVTYGTKATECLIHYGVNRNKITTGTNTVDVKYYYKNTNQNKLNKNQQEKFKFLYVGQLIERKGIIETITAFEKLKRYDWELTIVGSGPLEKKLTDIVKKKKLNNHIKFVGYKQQNEIILYFDSSHCLIVPSISEVWGLVINEGIATNTFTLASKYAGATGDIIIEEKNGKSIDPLDIDNYAKSLNWVLDNKEIVKQNSVPLKLWKKLHPFSYAKSILKAINAS